MELVETPTNRIMEKIMSNERELTKIELDAVSGGAATEGSSGSFHAFGGIGAGYPASPPANEAAMKAWNDLLRQYGF
jgi:hypothetical protein